MACSWGIVPDTTLHWKIWDGQCVVFNSASGQTHLLDPLPALLIRQIQEGYSDTEELFDQIGKLLALDLTGDVRNMLHETLRQLDALGLVEVTVP